MTWNGIYFGSLFGKTQYGIMKSLIGMITPIQVHTQKKTKMVRFYEKNRFIYDVHIYSVGVL